MIYEINNHPVNIDQLSEIFNSRISAISLDNDFIKANLIKDLGYYLFSDEINPYNYDAKNYLFNHDNKVLGFMFNFKPRELTRISKIMNYKYSKITGIRVLRNWVPHLDLSRSGKILNIILSGRGSSTIFYNQNLEETVRISGQNFYHFDPNRIIHSAEIVDKPMDIMGFIK